jgi:hypothetical protein
MSTSYYASSNLTVFPCVSRDTGTSNIDLNAKLMSEENITNIIKSITDRDSFVINYEKSGEWIEFILNGYYFKLDKFTFSGNIYASLITQPTSGYTLLKGDELVSSTKEFKGLVLSDTDSENAFALCISGNVPNDSLIKFNQPSLYLTSIDCGELKG